MEEVHELGNDKLHDNNMKVLYFIDDSICYTLCEHSLNITDIVCLNTNRFVMPKNDNKLKDKIFNFFEYQPYEVVMGRYICTYDELEECEGKFKKLIDGDDSIVFIVGVQEYRYKMRIKTSPFKTLADWVIENGARPHLIVTFNENFVDDNYNAILRLLPDVNKYASIAIYKLTEDAVRAKRSWQGIRNLTENDSKLFRERYYRIRETCLNTSKDFSRIINKIPDDGTVVQGMTYLYNHKLEMFEPYIFDCDDLSGSNADPIESIIEEIAPHDGKVMCNSLHILREMFAKKYHFKHNEIECRHDGDCNGTCIQCDEYAKELYFHVRRKLIASKKIKHKKGALKLNDHEKEVKLPVCCISRLRDGTDGNGIRTLLVTHDCTLKCKYCINKYALKKYPATHLLAADSLFDKICCDILYYEMTNGGVTFGGGEPLLYAEFIKIFNAYSVVDLNIAVETSLNVTRDKIELLIGVVDDWYIDIKDMNPEIYTAYTGKDNKYVISNLQYLLQKCSAEHLHIRVPRILRYNTDLDVNNSINILRKMGFKDIEIFEYRVDED